MFFLVPCDVCCLAVVPFVFCFCLRCRMFLFRVPCVFVFVCGVVCFCFLVIPFLVVFRFWICRCELLPTVKQGLVDHLEGSRDFSFVTIWP